MSEPAQTIAEMLREEGRQQGLREGLRGQQAMLFGMLAQRFGELPEEIVRRVKTADAEVLTRWGLRFVSARSIDEVFEP